MSLLKKFGEPWTRPTGEQGARTPLDPSIVIKVIILVFKSVNLIKNVYLKSLETPGLDQQVSRGYGPPGQPCPAYLDPTLS